MKPPPQSMRPGRLVFPALTAALLLFLGDRRIARDRSSGRFRSRGNGQRRGTGYAPAADNGWVDRTHSRVERDLFDTVVWFDRFFGDDRMVVTERPESYLRWKNELRWDQEEHYSFRSTVRASLRLPRLKDRWHLIISSESRGDPNAIIPEDPGNPGLNIGSHGRTSSTELVYDIFRTPHSILDVGAGVRVKIPPDAFVRTRFQHARPLALDYPRAVHGDRVLGRPGRFRRIEPGRPRTLARPTHPAPMVQLHHDHGEQATGGRGERSSPSSTSSPRKARSPSPGAPRARRDPSWVARITGSSPGTAGTSGGNGSSSRGSPTSTGRGRRTGAGNRCGARRCGWRSCSPGRGRIRRPMEGAGLDGGQRPAWCSSRRRDPSRRM